MRRDDVPYFDMHGRKIEEGDLLRSPHFRGPRRKMFYLYHVAVVRDGRMWMVPTSHLAGESFKKGGGACPLSCLDGAVEIIDGHRNGWWYERPTKKRGGKALTDRSAHPVHGPPETR